MKPSNYKAYIADLSKAAQPHSGFSITQLKPTSKLIREDIFYGAVSTNYGPALLGANAYGVCKVSFFDDQQQYHTLQSELMQQWPYAHCIEDTEQAQAIAEQVFESSGCTALNIILQGSDFQHQVWQALLQIPQGQLCTYQHIAQHIGRPKAYRAVGNAVGMNPLAYILPCHRVVRNSGDINGYRWGVDKKIAMLAKELNRV